MNAKKTLFPRRATKDREEHLFCPRRVANEREENLYCPRRATKDHEENLLSAKGREGQLYIFLVRGGRPQGAPLRVGELRWVMDGQEVV